MPAKPAWYGKIDHIIGQLQALPRPFVDRATLEFLLGVGRRRAQQIMAPCISERIGASALVDRDALIARLRELARRDDGYYERQRRRKLAQAIESLRQERIEHPQLLVEAPVTAVNQEFEYLPAGIRLEPGRVIVEFAEPREALEKFLALAMAISNDYQRFERTTCPK